MRDIIDIDIQYRKIKLSVFGSSPFKWFIHIPLVITMPNGFTHEHYLRYTQIVTGKDHPIEYVGHLPANLEALNNKLSTNWDFSCELMVKLGLFGKPIS